jgi:EmrB/QacA subfamily drug resistance transporter
MLDLLKHSVHPVVVTIENRSHRAWIAVVYVSAMFMSVLDTTIVTVALPAIGREFHAATSSVGLVPVAYLVALTVVIPVSGWVGDRIGGRLALLGSIGLFTLGSALCGIAPSLPLLVAFSALQGVGGAVMLPVGLAMLFRAYAPHERVRLSSVLALFTALGPAIGPILGGLLTTSLTWRLVFWINVPIGIAAIVVGALRLDAHRQPHPGRLDLAGLVLGAVGLGSLVAGVSEGPALGWTDPFVLGGIVVGAVLLIALVPVELRMRTPLLDLRLFGGHPVFAAATALYALGSVAYIGALYLIALFLQNGLGLSALESGLTSVGAAIGVMAGGQLVTRVLFPRIGPRALTALGSLVVAVTLALLALVGSGTSLWLVRLDLLGLGLGVAAVFIPSQAISMSTIPHAGIAKASPLFNAGKQLGSAVGVALLSAFVGAIAGAGAHAAAAPLLPFHVGFLVAAAIALLTVPVSFAIRRRGDAPATAPASARA